MAAVRLEDEGDSIDKTLIVALVDGKAGASSSVDPLASSTWDEVIGLLVWFFFEAICKQMNFADEKGKSRFFPLIGQSSLHNSECQFYLGSCWCHQLNYVKFWFKHTIQF